MNTIKQDLRSFAEKHNLIDRTWECFRQAYEVLLEEDYDFLKELGIHEKNLINTGEISVRYVMCSDDKEMIYVSVEIMDHAHHYLGDYRIFFDIFGNYADDFFYFENI